MGWGCLSQSEGGSLCAHAFEGSWSPFISRAIFANEGPPLQFHRGLTGQLGTMAVGDWAHRSDSPPLHWGRRFGVGTEGADLSDPNRTHKNYFIFPLPSFSFRPSLSPPFSTAFFLLRLFSSVVANHLHSFVPFFFSPSQLHRLLIHLHSFSTLNLHLDFPLQRQPSTITSLCGDITFYNISRLCHPFLCCLVRIRLSFGFVRECNPKYIRIFETPL